MASASIIFNTAKRDIASGVIDLGNPESPSDTIKAILVTSSFNGDDEDEFVSDPGTLGELSGTGYAAGFSGSGRKTLTTAIVNLDNPNNRAEFDADDVTWTAINAGTAAGVILYQHNTADADSRLIAYIHFSSAVTTNGGDFTIQWSSEGILQIS